jgi:hypothetical protein
MRSKLLLALPLITAALLPSGAIAQTPPAAPAPAAAPDSGHEARRAHWMEARLAHMRERLKITPAQDAAFTAFTQTLRDNGAAMHAAKEAERAKAATLNADELMHLRADGAAARAAGSQKEAAAFDTLYAQLSPEQKTLADQMAHRQFERMEHHWAEHRHGGKDD